MDKHGHAHGDKPMGPEDAVRSLFVLAEVALKANDYESAATAYASVLQIEQNVVASYNLASLYARGLGVRRDFTEAARLFRQAELLGNERAGKLCQKCMMDLVDDGLDDKTPAETYATMAVFVSNVYPEADDQRLETNRGLFAVAATHHDKGELDKAAKVFRAAAEYGDDEDSRRYLELLDA
jgi:TPR repeat protein